MNLCSDGHDEIAYEGRDCPFCDLQNELNDTKNELDDTKSELAQVQEQLDEVQKELNEYLKIE